MNNKNIVYGLVDKDTNEIRYIGKSTSGLERPREHFKPCNLKGNTHKVNWIKLCLSKNKKPEIIIIEECTNPEDLFSAEAFWINYYKLNGNLTNCTNGFEGTLGRECSNETREKIGKKISISRKGKPLPEGMHLPKQIIEIGGIKYRNCSKCLIDKPLESFSLKRKQKTYQGYCKSCALEYEQNYRKENPSPTLPEAEYNASRLPGARAGGEASKSPERRKQTSEMRSKAVIATHIDTNEVLKFKSAIAAKEAGFQNTNIGQAIKFNKPYKNYKWKFVA